MGSVAETLAEWTGTFSVRDLPASAIELAESAFLDTVGVALWGSALRGPRLLSQFAPERSGAQGVSVFGFRRRAAVLDAALVNGTSAHAELFDDNNIPMVAHPSAPLVAALLALGQNRHSSGREVLQAYCAGFEVGVKLGRALNPELYEAGWHATRVLGVLGVAAACAKLLRLSELEIRMALGIAASAAGGLRQNFGTMTMGLHAGLTARDGLHAALLASAGFESDPNALEGNYGYCRLFAAKEPKLQDLGQPHELLASGIIFKPYPSGAPTHAAIDAARAFHDRFGPIGALDVESVICRVHPWNFKTLRAGAPTSGLGGKVSLEYCVARALSSGDVVSAHFTDQAVHDPDMIALMDRIRVMPDQSLPDNGEFPAEVELLLSSGARAVERCEHPLGSPSRPLDRQALENKFRSCARGCLSGQSATAVLSDLRNLADLSDVETLCTRLEGDL